MAIDPKACTNFDRTDEELQEFLLFTIMVANKNADQTAAKLERFLHRRKSNQLPFDYIREHLNDLHNMLVANRVGQYARIEAAIRGVIELNPRTCTLEELLKVPGIGDKTARYFLLHTRRDCQYAVLDTHALAFMRRYGIDAPTSSPQSRKQYEQLEKKYTKLRKRLYPDMLAADFDLLMWTAQSGRLEGDFPFPELPSKKKRTVLN